MKLQKINHIGFKSTAKKYPLCCGKPAGCNRIDETCAFRNHAWKRAVVVAHPKFDGGEALRKAESLSPYKFCYECHGVHHVDEPHLNSGCRSICVCSMNGKRVK